MTTTTEPRTCRQCGAQLPPKKRSGPDRLFCPGDKCRGRWKRAHETPEQKAAIKARKRISDAKLKGHDFPLCEVCGQPIRNGRGRWHVACKPRDADTRSNHHAKKASGHSTIRKTPKKAATPRTVACSAFTAGSGIRSIPVKAERLADDAERMEKIARGEIRAQPRQYPEWMRRILARRDDVTKRLIQREEVENG